MISEQLTSFMLYRCVSPVTTCDYPFFAVDERRSVLLAFGENCLSFEWDVPTKLEHWLANDFVATGEVVTCDLATLQQLARASFADEAEFLLVRFDQQRALAGVEFSLVSQKLAEEGPEYRVEGRGLYRRLSRTPKWEREVTAGEKALLDVCVSMATELAAQYGAALHEPSPLSRRSAPLPQPPRP